MFRYGLSALAAAAAFAALAAAAAPAQKNHVIEAAAAGDSSAGFVINGNVYRLAGKCEGWEDGDRVVFADGSTAATCGAVQVTNIDRDSTCALQCE